MTLNVREAEERAKTYLRDGSNRDRCDRCGWPLVETIEGGCTVDNCSMRGAGKHYRPAEEQSMRHAVRRLLALLDLARPAAEWIAANHDESPGVIALLVKLGEAGLLEEKPDEPDCSCYEIIGGHQPGCAFHGRKP